MENNFWNIFFSNEIILVILAILVIILITLIIYLLKLEKKDSKKTSMIFAEDTSDLLDDLKEEAFMPSITNNNDEEAAIISTDELFSAADNIKKETGLDNSEIIDMYEQEQEKKAIISYEELLKNAAALSIKYEEPKEKEETEPAIRIIEINDNKTNDNKNNSYVESTNKVISYVKEEEFLKLLKQFRMDLET